MSRVKFFLFECVVDVLVIIASTFIIGYSMHFFTDLALGSSLAYGYVISFSCLILFLIVQAFRVVLKERD